ncbi:MAG TPA: phosphotransferase [Anaerolineaceae bacterium]|jgi:aminoglycoside 2''-phosphotransferase
MTTVDGLVGKIQQAVPDLVVRDARLSSSYGSYYFRLIVNDELEFLFPRTDQGNIRLNREIELLKALQGRLPLPIPVPQYWSPPNAPSGAAFLGYRALSGTLLSVALREENLPAPVFRRLVSQMANFMQALHDIPASSLGIDLPRSETREEISQMHADVHAKLVPAMRPEASGWIDRLFQPFLSNPHNFDYAPVVRHGALLGENIRIDPERGAVCGVDDFSRVSLGDPAVDAACLASISEAFFSELYQVDQDEIGELIWRAQFYKSTAALQSALAALEMGDDQAYQHGMAAYLPQSAGVPVDPRSPRTR